MYSEARLPVFKADYAYNWLCEFQSYFGMLCFSSSHIHTSYSAHQWIPLLLTQNIPLIQVSQLFPLLFSFNRATLDLVSIRDTDCKQLKWVSLPQTVTLCVLSMTFLGHLVWFPKPTVWTLPKIDRVIKAKKLRRKGHQKSSGSRTLGSRVKNCLFALFLILYVTLCDSP